MINSHHNIYKSLQCSIIFSTYMFSNSTQSNRTCYFIPIRGTFRKTLHWFSIKHFLAIYFYYRRQSTTNSISEILEALTLNLI